MLFENKLRHIETVFADSVILWITDEFLHWGGWGTEHKFAHWIQWTTAEPVNAHVLSCS